MLAKVHPEVSQSASQGITAPAIPGTRNQFPGLQHLGLSWTDDFGESKTGATWIETPRVDFVSADAPLHK